MARVQPHPNTLRQVCVTLVKPPPPLDVKKGGDEWKLFKQMWSNYCINTRLNDEEETSKRALFLHTLGKEGLALYNRMQLPADDFVDNIITAFDNHFFGRTSETYERYVFNKRDQKADESIEDYFSALRSLASACNFCDCLKDSLLRDRLVLGVKDSSTRKQLLQEADLNLETCIAMCRAAEATSSSQPVKTETWTEDTTVVEAGSVSPGDQRPCSKQDFSLSLGLRRCDRMASPDEVEMSEVDINTESDDSDDSALQWTTEHQSSGVPCDSTVQPMSDNASGSLNTSHVVSRLEHLASVHGEPRSFPEWTESSDRPMSLPHRRLSTEEMDHVREHSADSAADFVMKLEPAWSTEEEDSPDQPSAVYSTVQPMSDNISGSLLSLDTSHECYLCPAAFVLVSSLELHLASVHGEKLHVVLPGSSTPDAYDAGNCGDTEEGPYKCPSCDGSFDRPSSLQAHIKLVHEGAGPHLCDVHGAAFCQACHLAGRSNNPNLPGNDQGLYVHPDPPSSHPYTPVLTGVISIGFRGRKRGRPRGSGAGGRRLSGQIQSDQISSSLHRRLQIQGEEPPRPPKRQYRKRNPDAPRRKSVARAMTEGLLAEEGMERRAPRHNEPLNQRAVDVMSEWYRQHEDNPYPTKAEKAKMAAEGNITTMQVKSWFANKRNRSDNTRPKVQKRAMEEKLMHIYQRLSRSEGTATAQDGNASFREGGNSTIIEELSEIIRSKLEPGTAAEPDLS